MSESIRRTRGQLLRNLAGTLRPHQRYVWFSLAMLLCYSACRLLLPYVVLIAIDEHLTVGEMDGFTGLVAVFLAIAVVEALSRRVQLVALERAGQGALYDLRQRVFLHLQRLPASFYDKTPIGRLVGRVTTDVEALQEMFSSGVVTVLGDLVFLVAVVCILLGLSAELAVATFFMVPVLVVATLMIRVRVRRAYTAMRSQLSKLNAFLHEHVSGMSIVQMFAQEARIVDRFDAVNAGVRNAQLRSVRWESTLSAVTEMLGSFTTALILWYGGGLVLEGLEVAQPTQTLTLGTLFAFVEYMQRFFVPLNDLSLKLTVMQNAFVASDRIFELLDQPVETPDPAEPACAGGGGAIEFCGVGFGYDPDRPVLRDVSFRVEPGERVAIVGATGAGKSTVLGLLTRLYDIDRGKITLDGVDIREMGRADLRRQVGVVQQDVFLFRGTILDNIRLGHPEVTEEAAIAAANRLHLDEVVQRFPGGYLEPIAERGANLSSGEKQLIAFARILVVAPKVLALDEATSNVDSRTEELLQEAVRCVMEGRTAIAIAHRLSTVRDADRILVMDQGRLVETGSHDQLLARGGVYHRLWESM